MLTYNLLSVLRRTALPKELERARPKRLRFLLFAMAATATPRAAATGRPTTGAPGRPHAEYHTGPTGPNGLHLL
ncbi:hypothetical protein ACFL09_06465, partial [Planctomycetota bacterium]